MADRVFLSFWLRGYNGHTMLSALDKALRKFPMSRLLPGQILRVYALEMVEPPVFERSFTPEETHAELIAAAHDFQNPDCAFQVEMCWDLWQYDRTWKLKPATVLLTCFGPEFPTDYGEHLQLDLGPDVLFVPQLESGGFTAIQSNIRSLLHLAGDLAGALPVEKRTLWSESGENLAERLEGVVAEDSV